MIRRFILAVFCLFIVSACATGKAVKTSTIYSPAEFQITDINVDVPSDIENRGELRRLMTYASTNLALAYNEAVSISAPEYVMEVSMQSFRRSPRSKAAMRYRVILRNPDDGTEYRALPVAYGNVGNQSVEQSPEEGLIGGSLPEAFYRLYGLSETPPVVEASVAEEGLFADPAREENPSAANYYPSDVISTPAAPAITNAGGEPKVISCSVC